MPDEKRDSGLHAAAIGFFQRPLLIYLLLIGLTLVPFWQVCRNDFVTLDDPLYITDNPHVYNGLTFENVRWAFTTRQIGFWQPLTWLSLQLDASLFWPHAPWGFFLTNLLLHLANVLLLFHVLVRMTSAPVRSALVAALFAIHPMRVESVAWASERKDVLFAFFWLIAMLAYVNYASRPSFGRYLVVFVAMALSALAKSMAVTLPCVLLLLDIWPLRRFQAMTSDPTTKSSWSHWPLFVEKLPLLVLSVIFGGITLWSAQDAIIEQHLPVARRLLYVPVYYGWYIYKAFVPYPLGMYYPLPAIEDLWWRILVGVLLLGAGSAAAWYWRRQPALLIGWLWFLGVLALVMPLNVADRFTYVPHIGIYVALVWGLADLAVYWRLNVEPCVGLVTVVLGCLLCLTYVQTSYWRNSKTLWEHCAAVNGGAESEHNLGQALEEQKELDGAIHHYRLALEQKPNNAVTHNNLGVVLLAQGNLDEAIAQLRDAVDIDPNYTVAHSNLGLALFENGKIDEAIAHYHLALTINPNLVRSKHNVGRDKDPNFAHVHFNLGIALHTKRDLDGAITHYRKALDIDPNLSSAQIHLERALKDARDALVHFNLGKALYDSNNFDGAIAHYRSVLTIQPNAAGAYVNLGYALLRKGDVAEARKAAVQFLSIVPANNLERPLGEELLKQCDQAIIKVPGSSP